MSNYHYGKGDCIKDLGIRLAESAVDRAVFEEAWRSLGVVVAALYRKQPSYSTCPHCGFQSITKTATRTHVRRMHPGEKA